MGSSFQMVFSWASLRLMCLRKDEDKFVVGFDAPI